MKDSIKLSPKHGLNPCIRLCFWCGEPDGISILGKLPDDMEAPRQAVMDYEPCPDCVKKMKKGCTIISVTQDQPADHRPAIQNDPDIYPTGDWAVLSDDGVPKLPFTEETISSIMSMPEKKFFLEEEMFFKIVPRD